MAEIINWVQTQNQEKLAEIRIEAEVTPKTPLFKVLEKLEKAYQKNDIKELVFWLAYAKFYDFTATEGRKFFKKIEELWPSKRHPELSNKFHFLNSHFSENYSDRKDSAQMYNHTALFAELSLA